MATHDQNSTNFMQKYPYNLFTLSNGLRVLYVPWPNSESVTISMMGKVGRRAEAHKEIGAAHFLEHLFFDGTTKRPSALEVDSFIEYYGGVTNGSTSQETVEYWVKTLSKYDETAFDFLSDIFFNSLLRDSDIEKEKRVIGQEAASRRDDPQSIIYRSRLATLYPDQKIGQTIYDEEINLPNISAEILRGYMLRNYVAENFVLTVTGNINETRVQDLASRYFQKLFSGSEVKFEIPKITREKTIAIINKDFVQSKFSISFGGFPKNTKEATASYFLAKILGQGMSSRLFHKLRNELHLVYSASAANINFSDTGSFHISTSCNEESVQKATYVIFEEVKKLLNDGVEDKELEKARNKELSEWLMYLEKFTDYAHYLASQVLLFNKIKDAEKEMSDIESITKEDILNVARTIFSDQPKVNLLTKNLKELRVPDLV